MVDDSAGAESQAGSPSVRVPDDLMDQLERIDPKAARVADPVIGVGGVEGPLSVISLEGEPIATIRLNGDGLYLADLSPDLDVVIDDDDRWLDDGTDDGAGWSALQAPEDWPGDIGLLDFQSRMERYRSQVRELLRFDMRIGEENACDRVRIALRGVAYGRGMR